MYQTNENCNCAVLGSMKDKHCFSTLSFVETKLRNMLITQLDLVIWMFVWKFCLLPKPLLSRSSFTYVMHLILCLHWILAPNIFLFFCFNWKHEKMIKEGCVIKETSCMKYSNLIVKNITKHCNTRSISNVENYLLHTQNHYRQ
jgi:hypothetical protein